MGGVSNKTTSHITRVLDLTYFSRSQRSKFEKNYESWCILLLFDLECSNLVWICIWAPSTFTPNFGPIRFQIWLWGLAAILEKQLSPITLELMPGSSPNYYHSTSIKHTCHNTPVFDLTYFSGSQRSKFATKLWSWLILLLFDLESSNLMHDRVSRHHLHFY
jgi:hypothetical protein